MKKSSKLCLGAIALLSATVVLSSCTASFCSQQDKAHILYLYDGGVTVYTDKASRSYQVDGEPAVIINHEKVKIDDTETQTYKYLSFEESYGVTKTNESAAKTGYQVPSISFWGVFDQIILDNAYDEYLALKAEGKTDYVLPALADIKKEDLKADVDNYTADTLGLLDKFGYVKFGGLNEKGAYKLWIDFDTVLNTIMTDPTTYGLTVDELPTVDYINLYKKTMNGYVANARACLAIKNGLYGTYGPHNLPAEISPKKWTEWRGLLEFLFVWPIGAFLDVLTTGMLNSGVHNGTAQFLAILIVTFIVRGILLLATFKQTQSTNKMNALQPELSKIQAKYPNANTNKYEKQKLAMEQQKLYKKHKINPLTSLLVMVIQFPVFICVYGAMQGSAWLSTGAFLQLRLSASISSVLFSAAAWKTGAAVTALILFLIMAITQTGAMLLTNFLQKRRNKNIAKLGKNPTQTQQGRSMKIFTYVMLALIIFMGFTLQSALCVYWIVGALFSIAQTYVMHRLALRKGKNI